MESDNEKEYAAEEAAELLKGRDRNYATGFVRGFFGRSPILEATYHDKGSVITHLSDDECTQDFLDGLFAARQFDKRPLLPSARE
jgi:hypothetical protein